MVTIKEYPLIDISEVKNTKERILLMAVRMFAERGYSAVSMRDIAAAVNIKPPSIYNHFHSKEDLFDTIIESVKNVYLDFYNRLEKTLEQATSFEQVIDCLFSELFEVYHMFIYYGVSLMATEQFRNRTARDAFYNVYMKIGIDYSANIFDECIKKNWVKSFDTDKLATVFMNGVFMGSLLRAHEDQGNEVGFDANTQFLMLRSYMLGAVDIVD